MTETPRQRRTAASIVEGIKARYVNEQETLKKAQDEAEASLSRLILITEILNEAEKDVETDVIS